MHRPAYVDLASPDREAQPGYPAKRPRLESRLEARASDRAGPTPASGGTLIDLSADSPRQGSHALDKLDGEAPTTSRSHVPSGSRALWGELEDPAGPPRWRHVRRRTAVRSTCSNSDAPSCSSGSSAQDMPAPAAPWHSSRAWDGGLIDMVPPRAPQSHNFLPPPPITRRAAAMGIPPSDFALPPAAPPLPRREPRSSTRGLPSRTRDAGVRQFVQPPQARTAPQEAGAWRAEVEEQELARQMDRLDPMEVWAPALEADLPTPSWSGWRAAFGSEPSSRSRGLSLTEAMLGMLGDGSFQPPAPGDPRAPSTAAARGGHVPHMPRARRPHGSHMAELRHLSALREAMAGAGAGRLPLHLLLSDRDFDENDYEALLALDESVESRKGATITAINQIPTAVVGGASRACDGEVRCAICLEEYAAGSVQRCLRCSHRFHRACIDRWLARKATCPICQQACCD